MAKFEKVATMTRTANPLLLLVRSIMPIVMGTPGLRSSLASRFPIFNLAANAEEMISKLVGELSDPSSPYWGIISAILVNKNITSTVPFQKKQFDPKAYAEILSVPGAPSLGMAQADMPDLAAGGYGGPGGSTLLSSNEKRFVKVAQAQAQTPQKNEILDKVRSDVSKLMPKDINLDKFQSDVNRILRIPNQKTRQAEFQKYISSTASKLDQFHNYIVSQGFVKPV